MLKMVMENPTTLSGKVMLDKAMFRSSMKALI